MPHGLDQLAPLHPRPAHIHTPACNSHAEAPPYSIIDQSANPDLDEIMVHYVVLGDLFVVAYSSVVMVGAGALIRERIGRLVRVSVHRGYRRQGIARAVVQHLMHSARQRGMSRLLVETNSDWADAIGLYRQHGFREYDRDDVSVYMRRDLA